MMFPSGIGIIATLACLCSSELEPEVYDIYFDVGLFSPLIKKWKIDKSTLTREEAIKYITPWLLDTAHNKIYVTTE